MPILNLNGDQAMAYGAITAGVKMVTSYPGSPSSGTVQTLIERADKHDYYVEWSTNEKVAMEMGIGASIAGRRALVCTKSVGLNVMIDPLMALNLTPVHGGLVILLGDDPGCYASQNDQDSRSLAPFLEMPMIEPATPGEGYVMMLEAFEASEKMNTAIFIRETRSFTQQIEAIKVEDKNQDSNLGFTRESHRFVPVPMNVVEKHRELHQRIKKFTKWVNEMPYNRISGSGSKGIIGVGFAYQKLQDVVGVDLTGDFRILKLSALFPLPDQIIIQFLKDCEEVMIIEENEPYVETHIKEIAYDNSCQAKIYGKRSHHISWEGELFRWQIQETLTRFIPDLKPGKEYKPENEFKERPKTKSNCMNCRYDEFLDYLDEVAKSLDQKPIIVGDPGCLVTVSHRIDAKYAMGSAVAVADGIQKAGVDERVIALFGDSSFFHTTLPAICNASVNQSNILIIVLDNKSTLTSGHQPNPGVGQNAKGQVAKVLNMEGIAKACGIENFFSVDLDSTDLEIKKGIETALTCKGLAMLVVHISANP